MNSITAEIFDIERFAIKDGPGIRTVVFMQGCPLSCPWCSNPESRPFGKVLEHKESKCLHCGACAAACPQSAVSIKDGAVCIDRPSCNFCGACVDNCPGSALRISPRSMSVEDVVGIVLRDKDYYDHSGGGVTFSGGEALMQPEALLAMLKLCKTNGLHTAIETSMNAPYEIVRQIEPYTDLFLIDLKHTDGGKLREVTGANSELIFDNIRNLARLDSRKIRLRLPCIPGFNVDGEHFRKAFIFAKENDITGMDLLPYHTLGTGKYRQLGLEYEFGQDGPLDRKVLEPYAKEGISMGFDIKIL